MAEVLELPDDCIEHPTRWDLAVIEAQMLWPGDPDLRERYLVAVSIKLSAQQIDSMRLPNPTPTEVKDLAVSMLEAPRIKDFEDDAKKAFKRGAIAGQVLFEAIGYLEVDPANAALQVTKQRIADRVWPEIRASCKTINNAIWPLYRPVAHLWAAYAHRTRETGDNTFPCRAADLGIFLAAAEKLRLKGEAMRPSPKAPTTLLRAGDAVELPANINLPAVEIHFDPSQ